ncbi:MAG: hypothetical protein RL154_1579 [Pseudomonadota bacterium]
MLFITWVALIFMTININETHNEEFIASKEVSLGIAYETQFRAGEDITNIIITSLMNNQNIKRLIVKGLENPQDNILRENLQKELMPIYELLKQVGIRQLHFHTATNNSYLRMHKPECFGDSLVGIRPTVETVNKYKKNISGFEEGRIFNGFRYVYPIFDGDKHIGSVETSIASSKIVEKLTANSTANYQIIFNKQKVQNSVWKEDFNKNYQTSTISNAFVIESKRVPEFKTLDSLDKIVAIDSAKQLGLNSSFVCKADFNKTKYIVTFMPIKNFSGQYVGYLVEYSKSDYLDFLSNTLTRRIEIITIFSIIILVLLITLMKEASRKRIAQKELARFNESLQAEVNLQTSQIIKQSDTILKQAKYAALGEMIGVIAHQWRQPLNAISLGVQELRFIHQFQGSISRDEIDTFSKESLEQINYMSRTIDDFRNFFKSDKVAKMTPVIAIVNKALFLVQKQLNLNSITTIIVGEDFEAYVIDNELEQVMINILHNAQDQIISSQCQDKTIEIRLNKEAKTISIQDYAGGINDKNLSAIFKADFSSKGEKGTGLGLYMAQMIVEKHFEGSINVKNENGGAVFVVQLK